MSLSIRIEDVAKMMVNLDTTDLAGLVGLQDELMDVGSSIEDPSQECIAQACQYAADAVESIVLRSTDDANKSLEEVGQCIDYIQSVLDSVSAGGRVTDTRKPAFLQGEEAESIDTGCDEELLTAWIESCSSALNDLEAAVMDIDAGNTDAGQEAESRRVIHTIKGEAGILSFETIQKICHECESLIDLRAENDQPFPVNEVLEVVDWIRSCINALSENPSADLPDGSALLETLTNANGNSNADESASNADTGTDVPEAQSTTQTVESTDAAPESTAEEDSPAAPTEQPASAQGADATTEQSTDGASEPQQAEGAEAESYPTHQLEPTESGLVVFPPEAIIDETTSDFVCEALEHIANAESSLMDLENDLKNTELINTVFRAFHTIKGVAGFMNLTPIVDFTHVAETLLDKARSDKLDLDSDYLDLFLAACDILGQLIGSLQGDDAPSVEQYNAVLARLENACNGKSFAKNATAPKTPDASATKPRSDSTPAAENTTPATAAPPASQNTKPDSPASKPAGPAKAAAQQESKKAPAKRSAVKHDQTVKVNTLRMDALIDMVGELVIGYQMVAQDEAIQNVQVERTKRTIGHVSNIIRDLQEVAMSLRLVSLRSTFQKMARLVRDVSSKAGKNIRLIIEGEDVELDRGVVEQIADPLVHMIRNACDHGIEPPEERIEAGKPAEGTLWLRAYHQGGSIVIEIKEDGRGLDRNKILEKAISKGMISADKDTSEMTDQEVFNLIFMPGFSTAEVVTDISGRGVGMDVVRRNIESLRGKIDIESELGKGSTFKMQLPLTMAIIDGMVVRVGDQRYVIPTLTIEQSFRPEEKDIHTVVGRGEMVEVRGTLLPIYRAKKLFGLETGCDSIIDGLLVVVESRDSKYCLLVDEIVGQQQVVIKSLGHGVASIPGVSGGAILGDGRVALILDVGNLTKMTAGQCVEA